MARIFITGSTRGIGAETARQLIDLGHEVVVHARNSHARRRGAAGRFPTRTAIVVGELDSLISTSALAAKANEYGPFDVIIHNAGIGGGVAERAQTAEGFERIFHTNVIAPYMLTALMELPQRMIFLTSGLEANGTWEPEDLHWNNRAWNGMQAYSDSKLHDLMLALEIAARYPHVISNAVDPGWIKTDMGGPSAPDPVELGAETQVWLATSDDAEATASGRYLKRRKVLEPNPIALRRRRARRLVDELARLSGVQPSRPSRECLDGTPNTTMPRLTASACAVRRGIAVGHATGVAALRRGTTWFQPDACCRRRTRRRATAPGPSPSAAREDPSP